MKFSVTSLFMLAASVIAAPVVDTQLDAGALLRRELNKRAISDVDILQFALTLEHLENAFYHEGLRKFDQAAFDKLDYVKRTRFNIKEISYDESTHVTFLSGALKAAGVSPTKACTYDFGLTDDVSSFVATASVLEGVGVSAYLGAAAAISEAAYLTAAGSILTVEARHNAYIRNNIDPKHPQSPFPAPFDIPLDPNQVYTLASAFIKSCPDGNYPLPFTAFPALALQNTTPVRQNSMVTLKPTGVKLTGKLYCAWPNVAGTVYSAVTIKSGNAHCRVPHAVAGQAYAVLTTSSDSLSDDNTVAGPAIVAVQAPYTYPGFPM